MKGICILLKDRPVCQDGRIRREYRRVEWYDMEYAGYGDVKCKSAEEI